MISMIMISYLCIHLCYD